MANYAERVRQKSAGPEGAAKRDCGTHRPASTGQREVSDDAGNLDFPGFACSGAFREFESRAKATTDRFGVFEPALKGKNPRLFLAFALRPDGQ